MDAENSQKKLVLMRGLPGSGKSTLAQKIAGVNGLIFSTDDFFMVNGKYVYNPSNIGINHQKNLQRTILAMKNKSPLIIIDNTNIKLWEMRKYVEEAQKFGYQIEIKQPQTHWAFNYKQCGKKNSHDVPQQKIKIMLQNYQKFNTLQDIRTAKDAFRKNRKK